MPAYGFLFAFHSNYGFILYRFRHQAKYSKIAIFHTPAFDAPTGGGGGGVHVEVLS